MMARSVVQILQAGAVVALTAQCLRLSETSYTSHPPKPVRNLLLRRPNLRPKMVR